MLLISEIGVKAKCLVTRHFKFLEEEITYFFFVAVESVLVAGFSFSTL